MLGIVAAAAATTVTKIEFGEVAAAYPGKLAHDLPLRDSGVIPVTAHFADKAPAVAFLRFRHAGHTVHLPLTPAGSTATAKLEMGSASELLFDNRNGTYTVRYQLDEPGPHRINVEVRIRL